MAGTTPTRERLVDAGVGLFRRQGYNATGVKQVVTEAGAPFGSLYHHFPGGKEQLGAEVVRRSGGQYAELLPLVFDPAPDLVTGVEWFFAGAAAHLVETGWADACPIATVALEVSSVSEPLREACADVFTQWVDDGTARFARFGLPEPAARELVVAVLCALEGAFVLARALRSTEPLEVAGRTCAAAAQRVLDAAR